MNRLILACALFTAAATPAASQTIAPLPAYQPWMSTDVRDAWAQGYKGQGANIVVLDDFTGTRTFSGNIGSGSKSALHGVWVRDFVKAIAPDARITTQDFRSRLAVPLTAGLNIVNLSYGMYSKAGYSPSQISWSAQERSIISHAGGLAVISKAAGNDGRAMDAANAAGNVDYLNLALVGKPGAVFVGALNGNGTPTAQTTLASYSNRPGSNTAMQKQFLSVGVARNITGLAGTSFAAPIVSGYAAVIGSKFSTATPTQIVGQLLNTARQDTIKGYNVTLHGRGEASLSRALAPVAIK